MNIRTILLPVDFSHSSDAALKYASSLADDADALLHIIHVGEDSPAYLSGYGGFAYTTDLSEKIERENRELLQKVKPTIDGLNYVHHYLLGNPADEVLGFANREDIDLIVIGSHGRTGLSRLLLGSVAEAVVRRAKCPVLTVKQPAEDEASPSKKQGARSSGQRGPIDKHSLH